MVTAFVGRITQLEGQVPSPISPMNRVVQPKVKVTLRLTVSQDVVVSSPRGGLVTPELFKIKVTSLLTGQSGSLDVEPLLVLMTRYLLLFHDYCCVFLWLPL
jgi:hypothetical protein